MTEPGQMKIYTYHMKEMMYVTTCKKSFIKLGIIFTFAVLSLIVIILPQLLTTNEVEYHRRHTRYPTDLKYILIWTRPRRHRSKALLHRRTDYLPGQASFVNQKCPHINCYISYTKDILRRDEDFDAVVFDIDDVRKMDVNYLNLSRSPEQLYVFRSLEAPEKHPLCDHDLDHFFNWTWTYRLNSDIPQPFLDIYTFNDTIVGPKPNMTWMQKFKKSNKFHDKIKDKNKAVAWILTKCKLKSKHLDFIKDFKNELEGYNYTLDIYGPCSQNKKCPGGRALKCYKMVEKEYFFQLVIEEFLSEDYITEVMVSAMSHISIPIVMGAADYRNFLPPGSYINAQAFDFKKLGALIDYLIKNPEMYELFFDWKTYYTFKIHSRTQVCDLCTKLNEYNGSTSIQDNFRAWWDPEYKDVCQRLTLYKLFNDV